MNILKSVNNIKMIKLKCSYLGYDLVEIIEKENFSSHIPFPSKLYTLYFSDNEYMHIFSIKITSGECSDGFTTATWGSLLEYKKTSDTSYIPNFTLSENYEMSIVADIKDNMFVVYHEDHEFIKLDKDGGDIEFPDGKLLFYEPSTLIDGFSNLYI